MKTNITYAIKGLTCSNCAKKVIEALANHVGHVDISTDLSQITLQSPILEVPALNDKLKEIGNYTIGQPILTPLTVATIESDPSNVTKTTSSDDVSSSIARYKPLILVFSYILLITLSIEYVSGSFQMHRFMPNFMAGFFLIFSFFKLLDLNGFAYSYAMYDIGAKRFIGYAYIYPFIELGLGASYLLTYRPMLINAITLIVMVFSSIGVITAVLNKQKIKCACLGTGFNLPMTTVTIIEDLLMAAMAAYMLI
jgi:copper chaperone CopZ